jgi:hypothetical protein
MENCNHKMKHQQACGRPLSHPGRHLSQASLDKKAQGEKDRRRVVRVETKMRHRGQALEMPPNLLPGSALASLAKYRNSGMVRPGDKLFEQIAVRLARQEGLL